MVPRNAHFCVKTSGVQSKAKHSRKDQRQVLLRALHGLNTGKDFLLAQTPKVYVTRPHWSSSCSCSQKHTCSTVLWLKMRAPKCSRPEPNKPSQTHEHDLSKEKKVSFQISIFLSPAVLSFYCFLLCAVVPALAGQPGSTFTFAIWFAKVAEESYK